MHEPVREEHRTMQRCFAFDKGKHRACNARSQKHKLALNGPNRTMSGRAGDIPCCLRTISKKRQNESSSRRLDLYLGNECLCKDMYQS